MGKGNTFPIIKGPNEYRVIDSGTMVTVDKQSDFGLMILLTKTSVANFPVTNEMKSQAKSEWLRRHGREHENLKDWAQVAHAIASGTEVPEHWSWWNPDLPPSAHPF